MGTDPKTTVGALLSALPPVDKEFLAADRKRFFSALAATITFAYGDVPGDMAPTEAASLWRLNPAPKRDANGRFLPS